MQFLNRFQAFALALCSTFVLLLPFSRASALQDKPQSPPAQPANSTLAKPPAFAKSPSETEDLQQAINNAGNDRAALVRNLEDFLKKYPESRQRPQIYRALVEASMQLRDSARAADYAERIVAMVPEDMSVTLLAIQLLEQNGDQAALRRAVNYSTRVLDYVDRSSVDEKSPKVSKSEWDAEQKRDKVNMLVLRGRLYYKLHDFPNAAKDFQASIALTPTAVAADKLGEIAELDKDLDAAIKAYAQAFVLSDPSKASDNRRQIRQKLGNVWRLAHGSDQGLGDLLLHAYDDSIAPSDTAKPKRNADAQEPYDFILRNARDGSPYSLAVEKGNIIVLNFWATWCGPCRELEPHFERVAEKFQGSGVVFLAANCDEDETLVSSYLNDVKPRTSVVFADGLDRLLAVRSFPTIVVLDRAGKIAYRTEGFDPANVESGITAAVLRLLDASGKTNK